MLFSSLYYSKTTEIWLNVCGNPTTYVELHFMRDNVSCANFKLIDNNLFPYLVNDKWGSVNLNLFKQIGIQTMRTLADHSCKRGFSTRLLFCL